MIDEVCVCGLKEKYHVDLTSNIVGTTLQDEIDIVTTIQQKIAKQIALYGECCLNYKTDNLRTLEEKAKEKDNA